MQLLQKPRLFAVQPGTSSFGIQGVDIPIVDGVIAATSYEVVKGAQEFGFQEIGNPRDRENALKVMAARLYEDTYKRVIGNGMKEEVARAEAELAVSNAGYNDEIPAAAASASEEDGEDEDEDREEARPAKKKPSKKS